jgi:hypothetical protein
VVATEPVIEAAEPPRHVTSVPLATEDVVGTPPNPKKGWWRR